MSTRRRPCRLQQERLALAPCPVPPLSGSPRSRLQPYLLPQPIPLPNPSPHRRRNSIPELMRQHQNLSPMMRLMRKHVGEHRSASRPHRNPTPAIEFRHPPIRPSSQRIRQHPQTLCRTLLMRRSSLPHRAPVRIQRHRTLQMWRRIPNPNQPAVMQMRKERSNRPSAPCLTRRRSPPSTRIQMRQQMLVHQIIDGVSLNQNSGEFCFRTAACTRTHSRSHLMHLTECHPERSCRSRMRAATESKDPYTLPTVPNVDRHSPNNWASRSRFAVRSSKCHLERSICRSKAKANAQSKDPYTLPTAPNVERRSLDNCTDNIR